MSGLLEENMRGIQHHHAVGSEQMTDPYHFWRESLAGNKPAIVNEQLECGFYRMKRRDGTFWPVVVFRPFDKFPDVIAVKTGSLVMTHNAAIEAWPWFAANPITEEEYRRVAEQHLDWSDIDEAVASHDSAADLKQQIEAAVAGVKKYAKIESDEQSSRGQTLRALLLKLSKQADDERKAEKEPHLKAGRDVDAKWQPIVKAAADAAGIIRKAAERWEDIKLSAQATEGSNLPEPSKQVKGAFGKAASVSTYEAVEIVDIGTVFGAFKTHPDVIELLTKLAQRASDDGIFIPGIKKTTKSRIR